MSRVYFPTTSLNRFGVRVTDQRATLGAVHRFDSEPTPRSAMTPTGPMLGAVRAIMGEGPVVQTSFGPQPWPGPMPARGVPIYETAWPPPASAPSVPTSAPSGPISSSGGGGSVPTVPIAAGSFAAPPVSSQVGPTPTVNVPPPPPSSVILVSSGGGTQTPATPATVSGPVTYTTDANGNIVNSQTGAIILSAAQAASMGTSASALNAGNTAPASTTVTTTTPTGLVDQVTAWLGGTTPLLSYNVPNALLAAAVVLGFAWLNSGSKKR